MEEERVEAMHIDIIPTYAEEMRALGTRCCGLARHVEYRRVTCCSVQGPNFCDVICVCTCMTFAGVIIITFIVALFLFAFGVIPKINMD